MEAQVEAHASVQHATAHFRSAIQASPDEPANYVQLMQALFLDDQRAELATWMLRYEAHFPHRTRTNTFQFNLAMTLYGLYARSEALERFLRCLGEPPPAEPENMMLAGVEWQERTFHHIGLLLEKADEPLHAARAYHTTMRLLSAGHVQRGVPNKFGVYLVTALLSAGRVQEAAALHRALLGVPGGSVPALSRPITAFRAPLSAAGGPPFSPWLGLPHHARHVLADGASLRHDSGGAHALWSAAAPARQAMRQKIRDTQFPAVSCSQRLVLVYSLREASAGFGAETHGLVLALNLAVSLNRSLVLPRVDGFWYTEAAKCAQQGWECYFEPVCACHLEDTRPANRLAFDYAQALDARAFVPMQALGKGGDARARGEGAGDMVVALRAELAACLLCRVFHARTHARTRAHTHTPAHTHTHARTHTHTHTCRFWRGGRSWPRSFCGRRGGGASYRAGAAREGRWRASGCCRSAWLR